MPKALEDNSKNLKILGQNEHSRNNHQNKIYKTLSKIFSVLEKEDSFSFHSKERRVKQCTLQ